jgi:hypothetical protein
MASGANHNVEEHENCWCNPFWDGEFRMWIHLDETVPVGKVLIIPHCNATIINGEPVYVEEENNGTPS